MASLYKVFQIVAFLAASFVVSGASAQSIEAANHRPCAFASVHINSPSTPSPFPTPIPIPTPVPVVPAPDINDLEGRLDDLQTLVEVQSSVFDATVSRMESNLNLLLTILAIASLLTAILSLGILRVWIKSLVEDQLKATTEQQVSRAVQKEVARIREEWEPKFTELYEEYRRSIQQR